MRAYLMALLAALEARVPLVHPTMRHNIRLSRIGKVDRLVICMAGQCEVVLDEGDLDVQPVELLADAIAAELAKAKEAKRLMEEEGGRA